MGLPLGLSAKSPPAAAAAAAVHLQTRDGRQAKGCTMEEFNTSVLPAVLRAAREKHIMNPTICMDNASIHQQALAGGVAGLNKEDFMEIPAHSPDFNKVAEHVHAIVKRMFWEYVMDTPDAVPIKQRGKYKARRLQWVLDHVFRTGITKEGVAADAKSLKDEFQAIKLAGGGYAGKAWK